MTGSLLLAAVLNVVSLPPNGHLDCEVSTNVVLATSPEMSEIEFTLSLLSTPSNSVEVAFGTDEDLDGDISRAEKEFVIECECGAWQVVDPKDGAKYAFAESFGENEFRWCAWMARNHDSKTLRTRLNGNSLATAFPADMLFFKRSWTHMKITSRGKGNCFRNLNVAQSKGKFFIRVR